MRNKIILLFFAILLIQHEALSKSKKKYSKKIKVKKGRRGFGVFARMPAIINIPAKQTPSQERKNIGLIQSLTQLEEYKKALEGEQSSYAKKLKEVEEALEEIKKQSVIIKTKETETPPPYESKITETTDNEDNDDDNDDDTTA